MQAVAPLSLSRLMLLFLIFCVCVCVCECNLSRFLRGPTANTHSKRERVLKHARTHAHTHAHARMHTHTNTGTVGGVACVAVVTDGDTSVTTRNE